MLTLKKYRVMELMEAAGYKTQEDFATAVGVSRTWMSALLNGRATPTTDQLVLISRLLGVTIDDIADYPKALSLAGIPA
jgi:transcriptional regulator with XRE-family HTH domain